LFARPVLGTIHGEEVIAALRYFRTTIGGPLVIVWDQPMAHRTACRRDVLARHPEDFQVEWLPGYAPELNPEEPGNNCVKLAMLHAIPDSEDRLRHLARVTFQRLARKPHVLIHFFQHARLDVA